MKLLPYVVRQGDYLTKLAHTRGFSAEDVWNDPKNAELKERRGDMEVLCPGDILFLPDASPEPLDVQGGGSNVYAAEVPSVEVHLILKDADGPIANEPYTIGGLGDPVNGTTGADGGVSMAVPIHIREIELRVPGKHAVYTVLVGDLDPPDEPSGVAMRLDHLGYLDRSTAATDGGDLREAIAAFQSDQGMDPTGMLDPDTRKALIAVHGS